MEGAALSAPKYLGHDGACPSKYSPVNDVQCAFLDGQRRFLDRLAQGRMRMSGPAQIFRAAAKFHY